MHSKSLYAKPAKAVPRKYVSLKNQECSSLPCAHASQLKDISMTLVTINQLRLVPNVCQHDSSGHSDFVCTGLISFDAVPAQSMNSCLMWRARDKKKNFPVLIS